LFDETIGASLRRRWVAQVHQGVGAGLISDADLVQFAGQPIVAVDVDLHGQREPSFQLDMDETQRGVQPIDVQHQAAPEILLEARPTLAVLPAKGPAGFQAGATADAACLWAVPRDQPPGCRCPARLAGQVADRRAGLLDQRPHVLLEALGDLRSERLEVLEQHVFLGQEAFQAAGLAAGQVTAEDHAVKTGQHALEVFLVLDNEGLIGGNGGHGVFLSRRMGCCSTPSSRVETPFATICLVAAKLP